ncbi:MAG: DoxX family protein [Maribacter sp.]
MTPSSLGLSFLEVSDEFVAHIAYQGYPFDVMPEFYAWSICFMEAFGGILLIIGINTRMTAFFVFLTMAMGIFFRKWDGTWDIIPVFTFFCISLFLMGFGSGKWGLDYWFSQKLFKH